MQTPIPRCRCCAAELKHTFVDLGMSPLANAYVPLAKLRDMEPFYPLHAYVCATCFLVQLEEFAVPEQIFSDYAYFSSYSDHWLQHARAYTDMIIQRFDVNACSQVIEIASNDGYLLQYFRDRGIPVLGIEPATNVAQVAIQKGLPTVTAFFGKPLACEMVRQGTQADLLIGNNVLAHVPMVDDFVKGLRILLKPQGVITMEFPHLLRLMESNQFDTIYHEHFSYFSFSSVERLFLAHGLTLFDVEELPTHGGSLRIYARHQTDTTKPKSPRIADLLGREQAAGLSCLKTYLDFAEKAKESKRNILDFLIQAKRAGKSIAGYGAPAKAGTLFNYCGIGCDFVDYTVDRSPHKQGYALPGTHIPIYHPDKISQTRPDYLLILPWNLKEEIMAQMAHIRDWSGQFVVLTPDMRIYP